MLLILPGLGMLLPGPQTESLPQTPLRAGEVEGTDLVIHPWPQSGRDATRSATIPSHRLDGNATHLGTIDEPSRNWAIDSASMGQMTSFATIIANLSGNAVIEQDAYERCGANNPHIIELRRDADSGNSYLRILQGDTGRLAWQASLGDVGEPRAAPVVVDADDDGTHEILVAVDDSTGMSIDLWQPSLSCGPAGWTTGGHASERRWTLSDETLALGKNSADNLFGSSNEDVMSQLMIEEMDGTSPPELAVVGYDSTSGRPRVISVPIIVASSPPDVMWDVELDKGTHASDPSWLPGTGSAGSVILTTINEDSGSMWIWRLDGSTGSLEWAGTDLGVSDGDTRVPHRRLPGVLPTQLDDDEPLELVITIPTDADRNSATDATRWIAWESTDKSSIWTATAENGWADSPPVLADVDGNGITDRLCGITWTVTGLGDRRAWASCHELSESGTFMDWSRTIDHNGILSEGIATSSPVLLDLDGIGIPEMVFGYDRKVHALDGDDGTELSSTAWENGFTVAEPTIAEPALADIDGDGGLDLILGGQVITWAKSDLRGRQDGEAIRFVSPEPDPGDTVTIIVEVENTGTKATSERFDIDLFLDGEKILTKTFDDLEPASPAGDADPITFSTTWTATLGRHLFEIEIDPRHNQSQSTRDNDRDSSILDVLVPWEVSFRTGAVAELHSDHPTNVVMDLVKTGRRSGDWRVDLDSSTIPPGWSVLQSTGPIYNPGTAESSNLVFNITSPANVAGGEVFRIALNATSIESGIIIDGEIIVRTVRTSGLAVRGPNGTDMTTGHGIAGEAALAWFELENNGNTAVTVFWEYDADPWGTGRPKVITAGKEAPSYDLGPGETVELTLTLDVPLGVDDGANITTIFTAKLNDTVKANLSATFIAANAVITPSHIRSTPGAFEWEFSARGDPNSLLSWSLGTLNQIDWAWEGTGELTVVGDTISGTSDGDGHLTGGLILTTEMSTPPQFVQMNIDATHADISLQGTFEIIQISALTAAYLGETVVDLDADEEHLVVIEVQNTGNAVDSYTITVDSQTPTNGTLSAAPTSGLITVQPGAATSLGVRLQIDGEVPAAEKIPVTVRITSEHDSNIGILLELSARARNLTRWLTGSAPIQTLEPGTTANLSTSLLNQGNIAQRAVVGNASSSTPSICTLRSSGSELIDPSANGTLWFEVYVERFAPAGNHCQLNITLTATESDVTLNVDLIIAQNTEWLATTYNRTIPLGGGIVSLELTQHGNQPSHPILAFGFPTTPGWNYIAPVLNISDLDSTQSMTIDVEVTPPTGAAAGTIGVLQVVVADSMTSEVIRHELDLIVEPTVQIAHIGSTWVLDALSEGCASVALLQEGNTGIDATLQLINGPEWEFTTTSLRVIPNAATPIPCTLQPPEGWDGAETQLEFSANDGDGHDHRFNVTVRREKAAWLSTPVLMGTAGDEMLLHSSTTAMAVSIGNSALTSTSSGWAIPLKGIGWDMIEVTVHTTSGDVQLVVLTFTQAVIDATLICTTPDSIYDLETVAVTCQTTAESSEDLNLEIVVDGRFVSSSIVTPLLASQDLNYTGSDLDFGEGPSIHRIVFTLRDGSGHVTALSVVEVIQHNTLWNIGITGLEQDEEVLRITLLRAGGPLPKNIFCSIELSGAGSEGIHVIDLSGTLLAPIEITLDTSVDGEIRARLNCQAPFDIDRTSTDQEATMIWSSTATISVASGPTFSGWPLRILIAGLIGMVGAAIFLQTATHHEEDEEDPLAMMSTWTSESTKDDEQDEVDENLWDMFSDEVEVQPENVDKEEEEVEPVQQDEDIQEETESDVIDELRHRLGRKPKADENADRLDALERRMQSRKDKE